MSENYELRPFLKWAGGKRQLLPEIESNLPESIKKGKIKTYVEPFLGGGAVFFYMIENFEIENIILNDINADLINVYKTVRDNVDELIERLKIMQDEYIELTDDNRKIYFYEVRNKFNENRKKDLTTAANFIFLNKTCFNGLYRVNKSGGFNVPHGRYKNPNICDEDNLRKSSIALKNTKLLSMDFELLEEYIDGDTFVYLDPPYRPLDVTSNFNSYSKIAFNDLEQERLSKFYGELSLKGAKLLLSNSDPKNSNRNDNFLDELYSDFNIKRVFAKRIINSKGDLRGNITELLIANY